jgi:Ca2+/Na+ antiporter
VFLIAHGFTVVAFGTSAPELIVNIFASIKGSSEITLGNIIGKERKIDRWEGVLFVLIYVVYLLLLILNIF